jgi:hypothetical protein
VEVDMELDSLVLRRDGGTLRRGVCVPCGFGLVLACRSLADGDGRDALPEQALHMAADMEHVHARLLVRLHAALDGSAQLVQVANSLDEPAPPPVVDVLLVVKGW